MFPKHRQKKVHEVNHLNAVNFSCGKEKQNMEFMKNYSLNIISLVCNSVL